MRTKKRLLIATLVAAIVINGACRGPDRTRSAEDGSRRIAKAIDAAARAGTHRVRGMLGGRQRWTGYVAGPDESYLIDTGGGIHVENRRLGGVNYGRRVDVPGQPWEQYPSESPLDLLALTRGVVVRVEPGSDSARITLRFTGVDLLAALTHIRSVGRTDATVTIKGDYIEDITLRFADGTPAEITFWDYGADLSVEPVPAG